jgi:hypothetical protein
MDSEGYQTSNKITSFSGFPWTVVPSPDCDGRGATDGCFQVTANMIERVGNSQVAFGMDVFLFSADGNYYVNDASTINVYSGDVKFNLRLGQSDGTLTWPSSPSNFITFNLDIADKTDSTSASSSAVGTGGISYLSQFDLCCDGVCTVNSNVTLNNKNWHKQSVTFPVCEGSYTGLVYDPIISLTEHSPVDWVLIVGVSAAVIGLGAGAFLYNKNAKRANLNQPLSQQQV